MYSLIELTYLSIFPKETSCLPGKLPEAGSGEGRAGGTEGLVSPLSLDYRSKC